MATYQQFKILFYSYHLITAEDVLKTLIDLVTSGLYTRDAREGSFVGYLLSSHPASSLRPYNTGVHTVQSNAKGVFEIPSDENTNDKVVADATSARRAAHARKSGSPFSSSTTSKFRSALFPRLMRQADRDCRK